MTYYGILTKQVDEKETSIEEVVTGALDGVKERVNKFVDGVCDEIWTRIENHLACDASSNIRSTIARECESIIEAFLAGDKETMEKTNIISEYNFGRLPEVRDAIWAQCASDIEKARTEYLEKEVKNLREHNSILRNSRF